MLVSVLDTPPPVARIPPPLHTTMFPCIAVVMPFSRDTLTELNMTLVRLSEEPNGELSPTTTGARVRNNNPHAQ